MMFDVERCKLYEEFDRKGNANSTEYIICVCVCVCVALNGILK